MKKILMGVFIITGMYAGNTFTKGILTSEYLVKAKQEFPAKRYANEKFILAKDNNFKDAQKIEKSKERMLLGGKELSLAKYDLVIAKLYGARKSSGSVLASYLALEIGQHIWLMRNQELNNKYLKELAEDLYKHRYCRGYYQHGKFLWSDGKRSEAISVLSEGAKNCKDPYLLREIKLLSGKYKYLNKKTNRQGK